MSTKPLHIVVLGFVEEEKFLRHLGPNKCPTDMSIVRSSLIHLTGLDPEIESNKGNGQAIMLIHCQNLLNTLRTHVKELYCKLRMKTMTRLRL